MRACKGDHRHLTRMIPQIFGAISAAVGLIALIGWVMGLPLLTSFSPGLVPMAPSTALLFLILGGTSGAAPYLRRNDGLRRAAVVLAGLVSLTAIALLTTSSMGLRSKIEYLGLPVTGSAGGMPVGHMSPVTAFSFALVGLSFVISLSSGGDRQDGRWVPLSLAGLTIVVNVILALAYFVNLPLLYGGSFKPPSYPTSLAFVALGLSLLLISQPRAREVEEAGMTPAQASRSLLVTFLFLSLGIVTVGYLYFNNYELGLRSQVENQLSAIGGLKVGELVHWRAERLRDASILQDNTAFSRLVGRSFENGDTSQAGEELRVWLQRMLRESEYDRISLVDALGVERISVPGAPEPLGQVTAGEIKNLLHSPQVTIVDFYRETQDGPIHMEVLVPISSASEVDRLIGIVAFRIDPTGYLYPLIMQWPTPSDTAEALLVRRQGNQALFLNELKFDPEAALSMRIALDRRDQAAVEAVLGESGVMEGIDYRGVRVLADVRPVPGSPWFMVAKIDMEEALAPARPRLLEMAFLVAAMLIGAAGGVWAIWRQQRTRFYQTRYEMAQERSWLHELIARSLNEIYVLDPQSLRLTFANAGACRNLGYTAAEIGNLTLNNIMPMWSGSTLEETRSTTRWSEPEPRLFETVQRRKDGSEYPVEVHLQQVVTDGEAALLAICSDITKRKQAEEALRQSEARYRHTLDAMLEGCQILGFDWRYLYLNDVADEHNRRPKEELLGKKYMDMWPGIESTQVFAVIRHCMEQRSPQYMENEFTFPDGRNGWFELRIYPVPEGVVILSIDITERKQAERQLQQTLADLERSNSELEQFAYVASHDLQEPLRMVSGYAKLLARRYQGKLDADADEFIGYAVDGAARMEQLINDLLTFSRLGTRGEPFAPTDCEAILERALANLVVAIKETGAVITHGPLPEVMGDGTQLLQLFQNLIANAVRFHGDDPPVVHLSAGRSDDGWLFSVRDNGIGFDSNEYGEKIFVIFQRLHGRGEYPGTGMGLAICKKIVERHGGRIWTESLPGKGATFYFTLPLAEGGEK